MNVFNFKMAFVCDRANGCVNCILNREHWRSGKEKRKVVEKSMY